MPFLHGKDCMFESVESRISRSRFFSAGVQDHTTMARLWRTQDLPSAHLEEYLVIA